MSVVVIRATERFVFVFNPLAVDVGNLALRFLVGKRQTHEFPRMEFIARHVEHGQPFAQTVPAKVPHRAVTFRGFPRFEGAQVRGHADSLAKLNLGQPPHRQRTFGDLCSLQRSDERVRRLVDSGHVTAANEDDIAPVAERVVQRTDDGAARSRIAEIQKCVVPIVEFADGSVGRPVTQDDQITHDGHGRRSGLVADRGQLRACKFLDRLANSLGGRVVQPRRRGDNGRVRAAVANQVRDQVQVFQFLIHGRHGCGWCRG